MEFGFVVVLGLAVLLLVLLARTAVVVPQQHAYVVERLGRYLGTIGPGFHILMPFVDVIRYEHSLKEQVVELPRLVCVTRDNRQLEVSGFLRFQVVDPQKASYAVHNYVVAFLQLTQVTLRQEIGKLDADRAREDRDAVASAVTASIAGKTEPWGITVLGFELENMTSPS